MRYIAASWDPLKTVGVKFVDNDLCPFSKELAIDQLKHQVDWLRYVVGVNIAYQGTVNEYSFDERGSIFVEYWPQDDLPDDFLAYANHKADNSRLVWGRARFGTELVKTPAKFAGVFPHELLHVLGFEHWNEDLSIMNNFPYLHHTKQGLYTLADFWAFYNRFPGPFPPLYPAVYDYGDVTQGKCVILIPSINAFGAVNSNYSVYLHGSQRADGKWILETTRDDIRNVGFTMPPVCRIENDVLIMPLRYMGQSLLIQAGIDSHKPSSRTVFEVTSLAPMPDRQAA